MYFLIIISLKVLKANLESALEEKDRLVDKVAEGLKEIQRLEEVIQRMADLPKTKVYFRNWFLCVKHFHFAFVAQKQTGEFDIDFTREN